MTFQGESPINAGMRFALAKEHRDYYAHHHWIEFEEILSKAEVEALQKSIKALLAKRLKKPHTLSALPRELYALGRDLFREDPEIKKITCKRALAETASSLFKHSSLRLAFDQYIEETTPLSLQQMSCLTSLVGAIAIPLENSHGNVIYFSATAPLDLPFFSEPALIIAYSEPKTQYSPNEKDVNMHTLKKIGYTFGDLLNNDTHPLFHFL